MFTYGPVPSRRLGRSLGVSLIPPKTCSYSCVYCQLGRTNRLQAKRESFFPKERVLSEIERRSADADMDFITFVGDGEPTLSADLGWLMQKSRESTGKQIAVISNGSLLYQPEVREECAYADVVIPSLDAGSEEVFKKINRPHRGITFDVMLQGQVDFRRCYRGRIWLEIMLVQGVNDSESALLDIRKAVKRIEPDRIYIMTPIRPPAESWVQPPSPESILRAQKILGQPTTIASIESGDFGLDAFSNAREAILEIGSRHPLRLEQAQKIAARFAQTGMVDKLIAEGEIVKIVYHRRAYLLPSRFVMGKKRT